MLIKDLQVLSAYPPDLPHCSKKSVAHFPLQRKIMLLELPEVMERFLLYEITAERGFSKGWEQCLSQELLDDAKCPRGDLCWHC